MFVAARTTIFRVAAGVPVAKVVIDRVESSDFRQDWGRRASRHIHMP
jgi:hypothetical protein